MKRKYSVFLGNVGSCFDRYCPAYGKEYTVAELFERVKAIPLITAVDLVMDDSMMAMQGEIRRLLDETGLKVASVAVNLWSDKKYKNGALASIDPEIREQAIRESKAAIDFAKTVDCKTFTIWAAQEGFDYMFATDYVRYRELFADAIRELCLYDRDVDVTIEYKAKEPRVHSLMGTVGSTLLMLEKIGLPNGGIALDYGHAALGYEVPAESVAMCKMYGDRLKHIHINDNYGMWDDDMIVGSVHTISFLEFFYWLRRTDYQGYMTIDQFPYREDGRDAVAESAEWLDYLESLIDRADMKEIGAVIESGDAVKASKLMRKLMKG